MVQTIFDSLWCHWVPLTGSKFGLFAIMLKIKANKTDFSLFYYLFKRHIKGKQRHTERAMTTLQKRFYSVYIGNLCNCIRLNNVYTFVNDYTYIIMIKVKINVIYLPLVYIWPITLLCKQYLEKAFNIKSVFEIYRNKITSIQKLIKVVKMSK